MATVNMLYFFSLICLITSILLTWFKTDAFIEYCKLFNVFTQTIKNYNYTTSLSFPQYLYVTYKNSMKNRLNVFLLKLVTCPICLSAWLCIVLGIMFGYFLYIPILYIGSLFFYFKLVKFID